MPLDSIARLTSSSTANHALLSNVPAQAARARKRRAIARLQHHPDANISPTTTSQTTSLSRGRSHSAFPLQQPVSNPQPQHPLEQVQYKPRSALPFPFCLVDEDYDKELELLDKLRGMLIEELRQAQIQEHELVAALEHVQGLDPAELLFGMPLYEDNIQDSKLDPSLFEPLSFDDVQPLDLSTIFHPAPTTNILPLPFLSSPSYAPSSVPNEAPAPHNVLFSPNFTAALYAVANKRHNQSSPDGRNVNDLIIHHGENDTSEEDLDCLSTLDDILLESTQATYSKPELDDLSDVLSNLTSSYTSTPIINSDERSMAIDDALRWRWDHQSATNSRSHETADVDLELDLDLVAFLQNNEYDFSSTYSPSYMYSNAGFSESSSTQINIPPNVHGNADDSPEEQYPSGFDVDNVLASLAEEQPELPSETRNAETTQLSTVPSNLPNETSLPPSVNTDLKNRLDS